MESVIPRIEQVPPPVISRAENNQLFDYVKNFPNSVIDLLGSTTDTPNRNLKVQTNYNVIWTLINESFPSQTIQARLHRVKNQITLGHIHTVTPRN